MPNSIFFTDGRIVIMGRSAKRKQGKHANYILRNTRDFLAQRLVVLAWAENCPNQNLPTHFTDEPNLDCKEKEEAELDNNRFAIL